MFVVTDQHISDLSASSNEEAYLSIDLMGDKRYLTRYFMGDDFMVGDSSAVDILQDFDLA